MDRRRDTSEGFWLGYGGWESRNAIMGNTELRVPREKGAFTPPFHFMLGRLCDIYYIISWTRWTFFIIIINLEMLMLLPFRCRVCMGTCLAWGKVPGRRSCQGRGEIKILKLELRLRFKPHRIDAVADRISNCSLSYLCHGYFTLDVPYLVELGWIIS